MVTVSDLLEAEPLHVKPKGSKCGVCTLPEDIRVNYVERGIRDGKEHSLIGRTLQASGFKIGHYTVSKHAREHIK
jgi:hypothetical protein